MSIGDQIYGLEDEEEMILYKCTECGMISDSLGSIHAHIETHRGYTRFKIQIPLTRTSIADMSELMQRTDVLRVDDTTVIDVEY